MAFDYTTLRTETVETLIKEFGTDGQIAVNDATTGEPYESQLDSETLHDMKCVQTKFTKTTNNGTLIEEGDKLFLVSTEGVTIDPELANRIEIDSKAYQVVRIDPLKPGPVVMLWKVHVRK